MQHAPSLTAPPTRLAVAGVSGGVGTTAVAVSVTGIDARVFTGRAADVLVCRTTTESLLRASRAAAFLGQRLGAVAVNSLDGHRPSRPIAARIRLLEGSATTVVVPFVPALLAATDPHALLRSALQTPESDLSRPLRQFLSAIRKLTDATRQRPIEARAPRTVIATPRPRGLTR
ncbi:hypothetical protein [Pseudonocardia oroxyli]|uniref:Uncharacterized protein n=1 Tax=Pseudonocardia oroxyli TaxID=366584 RepID=A0A1G8CF23_PSEOR|nr:hypothetical protein [Pseudonocardia oroxyli]SDH43510.1 hypothetical protein SAMN05216377_12267 [Pseudonocardia oroxyli]